MSLSRTSKFSRFSRNRKAAALAEYVMLLLLIGGASVGLYMKFGVEVKDVYKDTAEILSGSTSDGGRNPYGPGGGTDAGGGDGGDGGGDGDSNKYDPGGGLVSSADVAQGCPLPVNNEYFADNHTVELARWAILLLPPQDPDNPPSRVGPWPVYAGSQHIRIPTNAKWELYQQKGERFAFTRNFYWYHNGTFTLGGEDPGSYAYCSDRSKDGPRAPDDSAAGPSTTSTVATGAFGSDDNPPTLGYFDQKDDVDWHRIEMNAGAGALRAEINPAFVQGRTPPSNGIAINIVDETGATPPGVTSAGNAVMAPSLAGGTYYLTAQNGSPSYGGLGGYEISAGIIEDTPETRTGARDITLETVWDESLPEADAGDMFHLVLPDDREVDLVVRARGIGDTPVGSLKLSVISVTNDGNATTETMVSPNSDDERFLLNHLASGPKEYYFLVKHFYGNRGDYRLTVEEVEDASPLSHRAAKMNLDEPLHPSIFDDYDVDFFEFENPEQQQVLVTMKVDDKRFVEFEVYDRDMNLVKGSTSERKAQVILDELPVGTYHIKARSTYYNGYGEYVIEAATLDDAPGTLELAADFPFGSTHSEDIAFVKDHDVYAFTVPTKQDVLLWTTGANQTMVMTLYDEAGNVLASYYPAYPQSQPRLLVNQMEAGNYKVRLTTRFDDTTDYTLGIGPVVDTPGDFAEARPFTLGERYAEVVSSVDDVDAFVFENDVEQALKIGASASRRFRIRLYDAEFNLIYDHGSSTLDKSFETGVLPVGTYYLLMSQHRGYTTDYDLYARPL